MNNDQALLNLINDLYHAKRESLLVVESALIRFPENNETYVIYWNAEKKDYKIINANEQGDKE